MYVDTLLSCFEKLSRVSTLRTFIYLGTLLSCSDTFIQVDTLDSRSHTFIMYPNNGHGCSGVFYPPGLSCFCMACPQDSSTLYFWAILTLMFCLQTKRANDVGVRGYCRLAWFIMVGELANTGHGVVEHRH